MKKQFLETGKIVSVHGLRGEVKIEPWSDTPEDICELEYIYIKNGTVPIKIQKAKVHKTGVIAKLEGIDTIEAAEGLRNHVIYLNREDITLEEGVYFVQDLIGCKVLDTETLVCYGEITDVFNTGANDIYEVKGDGKTILVPVAPGVVDKTDIDNGVVQVTLPEGLLDL